MTGLLTTSHYMRRDEDPAALGLVRLTARGLGEPLTIVHRPLTVPGRAWADLLEPGGADATQYYAASRVWSGSTPTCTHRTPSSSAPCSRR